MHNSRAYRRKMKAKHLKRRIRIVEDYRNSYRIGYVDGDFVNGVWVSNRTYVHLPKNSNLKRFWKKHSNKVVRKTKGISKGNQYRKYFDYQWMLD